MGLAPARDNRLNVENLYKNLLVVQPHTKGTAPSTKQGQPDYVWVKATLAVLAGPVSEELEEIAGTDQLPIVLEDMRLTATGVTSRLENLTGKYDDDGTPKLVVGIVGRYKNTNGGTSYSLDEPSEEGFALAAEYVNSDAGKETFPERDPFEDDSRASKAFA